MGYWPFQPPPEERIRAPLKAVVGGDAQAVPVTKANSVWRRHLRRGTVRTKELISLYLEIEWGGNVIPDGRSGNSQRATE